MALRGVAIGADGGNLALVSVDQSPERLARVGDSLGPLAVVVRIDEDSMLYRFAGVERRVSIRSATSTVATVVVPITPPVRLPGFVPGAPTIARVGGLEPGSGNNAFRQAVEKRVQAMASGR